MEFIGKIIDLDTRCRVFYDPIEMTVKTRQKDVAFVLLWNVILATTCASPLVAELKPFPGSTSCHRRPGFSPVWA